MSLFRIALSGKDNESVDIGRVLWAFGCLSFLLFEGWVVFRSDVFDMVNFGLGFSGLLMAGGGSLLLKAKTEPDVKEQTTQTELGV